MATGYKLKNYTTEVPAIRSIENIEKILVSFGATHINKEYSNGKVIALYFMLFVEELKTIPFKLPVNVGKVEIWMKKHNPKMREQLRKDKAERIAWKNMHELLHHQLSALELDQLEPLQVFLPYAYDPSSKETFYEKLKSGNYKQLGYNQ